MDTKLGRGGLVALALLLGIFIWGIAKARAHYDILACGATQRYHGKFTNKQAGALLLTFLVGLTARNPKKRDPFPDPFHFLFGSIFSVLSCLFFGLLKHLNAEQTGLNFCL